MYLNDDGEGSIVNNKELDYLHKRIKTSKSLKLSQILTNDLFIVEENNNGSVVKIIPLFNCDLITSSNDADRVLDNNCIICENKEDTLINFISNNQITDFNIYHKILEFNGSWLIGTVYDNENYTSISGVSLLIEVLDNNNVIETSTIITDLYGNFNMDLNQYTSNYNIRITANYNNITRIFLNMERV